MFKIVQTVEDNEVTLCVVPENWEENGILYWPLGKKGMSLRKDATSIPNRNTWSKQNCIVKKHNIQTFREANQIELHLSQFIDTEDEESYKQQMVPPNQRNDVTDLNFLISNKQPAAAAVEDVQNNVHYETSTNEITASSASMPIKFLTINQADITTSTVDSAAASKTTEIINNNPLIFAINEADEEVVTFPANFNLNTFNQVALDEKLQIICNNQKNIIEEQQKIRNDISALHAKFDKLVDILIKKANISNNVSEDDSLENEVAEMLPLSSEHTMNVLESKLQENDFEAAFVKYLSKVGGVAGNKNVSKIAYMVMDRIFERSLLIQCSWTGSSKKKDVKKICFLRFTRVIQTFFKIINLSDSRYTIKDNDDFLRRILKNSVSRNNQIGTARKRKPANELEEINKDTEAINNAGDITNNSTIDEDLDHNHDTNDKQLE